MNKVAFVLWYGNEVIDEIHAPYNMGEKEVRAKMLANHQIIPSLGPSYLAPFEKQEIIRCGGVIKVYPLGV